MTKIKKSKKDGCFTLLILILIPLSILYLEIFGEGIYQEENIAEKVINQLFLEIINEPIF
jgi:hypothetical protein